MVSWSSSSSAIIATSGMVTRPVFGQPDAQVVLTATLYKGMATNTKNFSLTVITAPITDTQAVEMASNELRIELHGQNANGITNDIGLTNLGAHGVMVSWGSSADSFIATDGMVTRPEVGQLDAQVVLTATLYKGMVTNTKPFMLTVLAIPDPNIVVVSNARSVLQIELRGQATNGIISNIGLTNLGTNGVMISWSSSHPSTIATDGMVTRPLYAEGNQSVVLTASLSKGMVTNTKPFTLTVLTLPDPNIAAVSNARDALEIIYAEGESSNNVKKNIGLTNLGTGGVMVSWSSSHPSTIATSGRVTRPAFGEPDQMVSLTAMLYKGEVTNTNVFSLTVLASRNSPQLIDITSLTQLDAIRYDLDGNGEIDTNVATAGSNAYTNAFPSLDTTVNYRGYELLNDLDFAGSAWTNGEGWDPIGDYSFNREVPCFSF